MRLITQRENSNLVHIKHSSKYTGVSWMKRNKKWRARIIVNNKEEHLGVFYNEIDAHMAYQSRLLNLTQNQYVSSQTL